MKRMPMIQKPARRTRGWTALCVVLLIAGVSAFGPTAADAGGAEDALALYDHRRVVTVDNPGDMLSGHQVRVSFDTGTEISEGRMQADCADVRFRSALGALDVPFWLESGCGTQDTLFWVAPPVILSGENTLYLYYGNPDVSSASDPVATFPVYQDFTDGEHDGWEAHGGAQIPGVEDDALQVHTSGTSQAVLYMDAETDRDYRVEASIKIAPGIRDRGYAGLGFLAQDGENTYISRSTDFSRLNIVQDGEFDRLTSGADVTVGVFNHYSAWFDGDTIHASIDGDTVSAEDPTFGSGHVGISSWWGLSGDHAIDWIWVHSDLDPAPAVSVGDLEDCSLNLVCQ